MIFHNDIQFYRMFPAGFCVAMVSIYIISLFKMKPMKPKEPDHPPVFLQKNKTQDAGEQWTYMNI